MKIFTDSLHKIAYATDASVYREIPYGVAYPETIGDIQELMRMARERHTHLIPRAGGTSIAGQVVGSGIVVDISKHWNHILEINQEERWARVEPGVVRDEQNIALKPYGLSSLQPQIKIEKHASGKLVLNTGSLRLKFRKL